MGGLGCCDVEGNNVAGPAGAGRSRSDPFPMSPMKAFPEKPPEWNIAIFIQTVQIVVTPSISASATTSLPWSWDARSARSIAPDERNDGQRCRTMSTEQLEAQVALLASVLPLVRA